MAGKFAEKFKALKARVLPEEGKARGFAKLRQKPGGMLMKLKKYINAD